MLSSTSLLLSVLSLASTSLAQEDAFTPCPLLGPRFPIPHATAGSSIIKEGGKNLTLALDEYVAKGDGDFGPITPNTTSFSIALFSTEKSNSTGSFFYEYHHTAPSLNNTTQGVKKVDADTVYRIGDLTTLFTAWLFLIEAGEQYWKEPVCKYVPELASAGKVQWDKITLGDLAAHLGGIGRYAPTPKEQNSELASLLKTLGQSSNATSPCASGASSCTRGEFLSYFNKQAPVFQPATTPIFSNAGYMILAYALETIKGKPFADLLDESILSPLNMSSTSLLQASSDDTIIPSSSPATEWDTPIAAEAAFNGLYSSTSDVSTALQALFASDFLDPATTRRWLKPVTHTSNRANSVGRPWEIYSLTVDGPSPVIPVYQVRGNVGFYSSHIGLVPDYNVGFVILGADSEINPDLNAYADLISVALIPALEENAITQATLTFSGTYTSSNSSELTIAPATDSTPGLALTNFTSGSTDVFAIYASLNNIEPEDLSFRLYPTDISEKTSSGEKMVFRAVFQDVTELADAGTPTCDSWRYIDELQLNGVSMDEFIFEVSADGGVNVEVPALELKMNKEDS